MDHSLHVGAQHGDLLVRVRPEDGAERGDTGVVDEHVHLEAEVLHPLKQRAAGGGVGQVGGEYLHSDAVAGGQFVGQRAQLRLGPGHQGQAKPAAGQQTGERFADARRGTSHQARAVGSGGRQAHGLSVGRRWRERPTGQRVSRSAVQRRAHRSHDRSLPLQLVRPRHPHLIVDEQP